MSATARRLPLAEAEALADELVELLADACKRIVVAGSIRRGAVTVGDVEIVAVPRTEAFSAGLFGAVGTIDLLDERCWDLLTEGVVQLRLDAIGRRAWGPKHKRVLFDGLPVDLFSVIDPAQWGVQLLIRTGPAAFSKHVVTRRRQGGLLPDWLAVHDGAIWNGEELVPTREEADVFGVLGLPYILPERRTGDERAAVPRWNAST